MSYELERKNNELEKQIQAINRELLQELDGVRQILNMNLAQKAEYKDLEPLSQSLKGKVSSEYLHTSLDKLQNEVHFQMSQMKKDWSAKAKKKDEGKRQESFRKQEVIEREATQEEVKRINDKLQKLAI
mmetsp:Transcript_26870/g.25922  ORF Transcript_26870/g.25922 Transcript_26870/m.25922 type:complete len:129 (+) Transcript_26870:86-472(+)